MPTSEPKKQHSWFYWENNQRADEAIHDPILAEGDVKAAQEVSRAVAKRAGLSDADYDALISKD